MLAICFGCHRFHDYVYGKEIRIETDHKPLLVIMAKPIYKLLACMQRMRIQNYNATLTHVQGTNMFFVDALSRPHSTSISEEDLFDNNFSVAKVTTSNITSRIQNEYKTDLVMSDFMHQIKQGLI